MKPLKNNKFHKLIRANDNLYLWIWLVCILFLVWDIVIQMLEYISGHVDYQEFMISDWLINYEGGFVRRGIIGQILLWCYKIIPYNVAHVIILLNFVGGYLLIRLLFHIFKNNGWSLYLLPFPICFCPVFLGQRRDHWMLLLAFLIFSSYKSYCVNKQGFPYKLHFLSIITILIYEPSFFFIFPILITHTFLSGRNFLKTLYFWAPAMIAMGAICVFSGNEIISQKIWESWMPCFESYPIGTENIHVVGKSVDFLGKNTWTVICSHFKFVWLGEFVWKIPSAPFTLLTLFFTYLMLTRLNTIKIGMYPFKAFDSVQLGSIMLLQLIFLLPMLGFLSCDVGRIIPYWTISSLFLYHFFRGRNFVIPPIYNLSQYVQKMTAGWKIVTSKKIYTLVLLLLPVSYAGGSSLLFCFAFIPADLKYKLFHLILG